jgi:aspartate racemase
MRHLGIVGHSAEGAGLCFVSFCHDGEARLGPGLHPDVTLDCIAMGVSMAAWDAGDHDAIRATLAESVRRLAEAGADFFVCPDNTAHLALERPGDDLPLPGLHIAAVVADQAVADGRSRVGLLGTRYLVDGPVYPAALAARDIAVELPSDDERELVNRIIFDELVAGRFDDGARRQVVGIIERYARQGCDAVALVCTEIPILVAPADSPLPTLDSTRLLASAACRVAVGDDPLPTWRGGPVPHRPVP